MVQYANFYNLVQWFFFSKSRFSENSLWVFCKQNLFDNRIIITCIYNYEKLDRNWGEKVISLDFELKF